MYIIFMLRENLGMNMVRNFTFNVSKKFEKAADS